MIFGSRAVLSISKLINFETQIVLEEYEKENLKLRELQYEEVKTELKGKISVLSEDLARFSGGNEYFCATCYF